MKSHEVLIVAAAAAAAFPVADSAFTQDAAESHPGSSQHDHVGAVKHTILEQFGVTSTEVRVEMKYTQDPKTVWNPRLNTNSDKSYCYHSVFPWTVHYCEGSVQESYYQGWPYVREEIRAYYTHPGGISYEMIASLLAWGASTDPNGGSDWSFQCVLANGALPAFWSSHCSGARF